jgi:5-methylcytosine-specific restriction endonuclease McrA
MEYIISNSYDGYNRKLYKGFCKICNAEFYKPQHVNKTTCSIKCSGELKQKEKVEITCANCKSNFKRKKSSLTNSKSGLFFCTRKCKDYAQSLKGGIKEIQPEHYKSGLSSYRIRAFREYASKCAFCSYTKDEKMLEVDHIDSNRENNDINNLQILCVWCHRLKTLKVSPHAWDGNLV